jgi:O-methyltransferase
MPAFDYMGDNMALMGKNTGFLQDPKFVAAWETASELNREGWRGTSPDIRWRAHVACWAATQALRLEGDFVECGVYTGLLSLTVCNYVDFNETARNFWLFDTFAGIPLGHLEGQEVEHAQYMNEHIYFDVYELAQRNFAPFKKAHLVRGVLPDTIAQVSIDRIAYLSVDLNNAYAEKGAIERLWPKVVPGGVIVLDDYAFINRVLQYEMWNSFAESVGRSILTLPTGQGLLIR